MVSFHAISSRVCGTLKGSRGGGGVAPHAGVQPALPARVNLSKRRSGESEARAQGQEGGTWSSTWWGVIAHLTAGGSQRSGPTHTGFLPADGAGGRGEVHQGGSRVTSVSK